MVEEKCPGRNTEGNRTQIIKLYGTSFLDLSQSTRRIVTVDSHGFQRLTAASILSLIYVCKNMEDKMAKWLREMH